MRKFIVAGNWKMNTTVPEGIELAKAVLEKSKDGKSPISSKSVMALAFFPQAQHSLFGRDLAILCKKDWLSSVRNS